MRFRPLHVLVLVAFGALLSIAVAWRSAVLGTSGGFRSLDATDAASLWRRHAADPVLIGPARAESASGLGITHIMLSGRSSAATDSQRPYMCVVTRAGWPLRCLEGEQHAAANGSPYHAQAIWTVPDRLWWGGSNLPLRPLPLGFFLDTVVFSALVWAVLRLATQIRRRARLDRGQCPRCRYVQMPPYSDGAAPCSECGYAYSHALHSRPRQILRPWMLPLVLPQGVLLVAWSLGFVNWPWLRFQLRYAEPVLTPWSAVSATVIALWIAAIAYVACADRTRLQRRCLSAGLGLMFAGTLYVAAFVLLVRAGA